VGTTIPECILRKWGMSVYVKVKVKFSLERAMKAQRGSV
jgi:hypothetical protein